MGSIFAIGDIHGCIHKLDALLGKIVIDFTRDTLLFVGDYIDRGRHAFEVVERLISLKNRYPGIILLKGNHEDMLQHYLAGEDKLSYLSNGGRQTLESYLRHKRSGEGFPIPQTHLDFFHSLALYHQTERYIFVHAGLKPKVPLERQVPEDLLWIRERFIGSHYDFGKTVVFGHTPFPAPFVDTNKIGIDTGAVYGRQLTCVQLPELVFYAAG